MKNRNVIFTKTSPRVRPRLGVDDGYAKYVCNHDLFLGNITQASSVTTDIDPVSITNNLELPHLMKWLSALTQYDVLEKD